MRRLDNIAYSRYKDCVLDLYLPEQESFDVVVFFHGGGLESGGKEDNIDAYSELTDNGIAVASANYRMYPNAKYPDFIEDAAEAVNWVMEHIESYGRYGNLYIGGSSAGAYLSMMLCLDKRYLAKHSIDSNVIKGYIFDSPQPTTHFNLLQERNMDIRRVIVDDSAPIFHICENSKIPPMLILVSDGDIPNRFEQIQLFCSTLKHFGCPEDSIHYKLMKGFGHTGYDHVMNEKGKNILAHLIIEFIRSDS